VLTKRRQLPNDFALFLQAVLLYMVITFPDESNAEQLVAWDAATDCSGLLEKLSLEQSGLPG